MFVQTLSVALSVLFFFSPVTTAELNICPLGAMIGDPVIFWLRICGLQKNGARWRGRARASRELFPPLVRVSASFRVHLPVPLGSTGSGFPSFCPHRLQATVALSYIPQNQCLLLHPTLLLSPPRTK